MPLAGLACGGGGDVVGYESGDVRRAGVGRAEYLASLGVVGCCASPDSVLGEDGWGDSWLVGRSSGGEGEEGDQAGCCEGLHGDF